MSEQPKVEIQMPVNKLSYSAMTQLFRNPIIFKLKYILNVYDSKMGMGGMVGRAAHEALKVYYNGNPAIPRPADKDKARELAIDTGMAYLNKYNDSYIDYKKTGSREIMLKTYAQAMQFYFAEEPEYNEIMLMEEKLEAEMHTIDGQLLPLPGVGIPDLVHKRKDGGIEIIDTKFVKSFTDYETEDYIKIIQSQFLWHLLRDAKGINADRMLFREIKTSENTRENAGKPQIRDYAIPFSHEQYRTIFYNMYKDAVRFISNPNAIYLPNLSDPFDGEQSGLLYAQGLLNSDMSDVEVMHKVKDVAFISKKFVPSRLERIENQHLNPEEKIKLRLAEFGIPVEPAETIAGTSVTQYRFKVSAGVRMSVFEKHRADIALALEAKSDIRIIAPIPGTSLVGVEVPNEARTTVGMGDQHLTPGTLMLPIGVTVQGEVIKAPLDEMPHLLIAGATGAGKSILLHGLITALIKQLKPSEMDLILIDPKRVELVAFAKDPHVSGKILYEYEDAADKLARLVNVMEERYQRLEACSVRNISEYNKISSGIKKKMPYIVVVIDEFADFIIRSKMQERKNKKNPPKIKKGQKPPADHDVEILIARLAAMARAVGIHLVIATQRPSVDVITGLIKANFPTRIALTTASATDSRIILGEDGAEKLSGKGDMLFMHPGRHGKVRLQGFLTE